MSNFLYIPKLNPISFRKGSVGDFNDDFSEQFAYANRSKHFDDRLFVDTLQPWEQPVTYAQKIEQDDITYLQFVSNFDPISVEVVNQYNQVVGGGNAVQKRQDKFNPGYYAYEFAINWASYDPGCYHVTLPAFNYISEPIIISEKHENTVLFSYFHTRQHEDVIFQTGIKFSFRVEGHFGRLLPKLNLQLYKDQKQNPYTLSGKPYHTFPLNVGGTRGAPDWVVQLMNYIWSCNNVLIGYEASDLRPYGLFSEGNWEFMGEEKYAMRSINMEIQPGLNRGSKIISAEVNTEKIVVVSYNIPGRVFGGMDNSTEVIQIESFE